MTPATADLVQRTQRVAGECEKFFRLAAFQAEAAPDRKAAETGLRHAIGLRQAMDTVRRQAGEAAP